MKVFVAAGGTGGHITPGIAIANKLKELGNEVIFIGTTGGMEVDLVPKAGYDIRYIHARGIRNSNPIDNIKTFVELLRGISEMKKIIKNEKVDFVIGTGGYVTAPAIIAALKCNIPTMIHESNALPGKLQDGFLGKVDVVACGFEDTIKKLPKAKHAVYTGNPTKLVSGFTKEDTKKKLRNN